VGHAFSPESLTEAHSEALERALWIAVRTLNERVALNRSLVRQFSGKLDIRQRLEEHAGSAEQDVKLLREILERL
jgi:two-component system chemotaxis response regulator CheB